MIDFEGVIERGSRDEFLLHQLDPQRLPAHVAIIMDGNGRWAARRGKPRVMGHRVGVDAVRESVETAARLGIDALSRHLYTAELPDPDLLIRTSGEMRVSNFLLWQIAYTEIYVTETLWPDFRRADLFEAIIEFQKRERRYGGIESTEQSSSAARIAK